MIIVIEGPDKCGKSHLIREILRGFEPDKSHEIVFSNADEQDGMGYLYEFVNHLDSPIASVWHRGWVSEYVYGTLLGQPRTFARDPYLAEWFYSRALAGRGGSFIMLPTDPNELLERRDESDFAEDIVSSASEFLAYKYYAERWGYEILWNDYTDGLKLKKNVVAARKSAFIPTHKIPSTEYIGALNPIYTFVGQTNHQMDFQQIPFYSRPTAEYFRPLGTSVIRTFGYSTIAGFEKNHRRFPHLFKRVIAVGGAANRSLPELPNIAMGPNMPSGFEVARFCEDFEEAAARHYSWVPRKS